MSLSLECIFTTPIGNIIIIFLLVPVSCCVIFKFNFEVFDEKQCRTNIKAQKYTHIH